MDILIEFENCWSKGLTYFLDSTRLQQLLHFSQVVEAAADKNKQFAKKLAERDTQIFVNIPALLILKTLEKEDKEICKLFYP